MSPRVGRFSRQTLDGTSPAAAQRLLVVDVDQRLDTGLGSEAATAAGTNDLEGSRAQDCARWLESRLDDREEAAQAGQAHWSASSRARRSSVLRFASSARASASRSSHSSNAVSSDRTQMPLTTWSTHASTRWPRTSIRKCVGLNPMTTER